MTDLDVRPWQVDAACANQPEVDHLFFPPSSGRPSVGWAAGKALCASCPVRQQCLDQALRDEERALGQPRFGLFGGATPQERYEMAVQRQADDGGIVSTYRYR